MAVEEVSSQADVPACNGCRHIVAVQKYGLNQKNKKERRYENYSLPLLSDATLQWQRATTCNSVLPHETICNVRKRDWQAQLNVLSSEMYLDAPQNTKVQK